MKIFRKVKNALISIGVAIISFPNKIFAIQQPQDLYGPPVATMYGVAKPSPIISIWNIARVLIIPVALLIGIIVYFKKSKSSKKKKILVTMCIIVLVMILYFIIDKIIYEFI